CDLVTGVQTCALPIFAVQVKEPTCGRERGAPTSTDCAAEEGARSRPTHEWGARSWSSYIDGFHRSSRPSRSSGPRPSCVGRHHITTRPRRTSSPILQNLEGSVRSHGTTVPGRRA